MNSINQHTQMYLETYLINVMSPQIWNLKWLTNIFYKTIEDQVTNSIMQVNQIILCQTELILSSIQINESLTNLSLFSYYNYNK